MGSTSSNNINVTEKNYQVLSSEKTFMIIRM